MSTTTEFTPPSAKTVPMLLVGLFFPQLLLSQGHTGRRWATGFSSEEATWVAGLHGELVLRWVMLWMAFMIGTSFVAPYVGLLGLGIAYFGFAFLWFFQFICLKRIAKQAQAAAAAKGLSA